MPGHRPDLSTLSPREYFRSHNNAQNLGIGSPGPLGRLLIRNEPGHDTIPELYPLTTTSPAYPHAQIPENTIDKPGRSAFAHTEFELMLRVKGIRNLVVAGVTTDVCVSSTVRDANDRGFDCVVVEDCCAASTEDVHRGMVEGVRLEGGIFGATCREPEVVGWLGRWCEERDRRVG